MTWIGCPARCSVRREPLRCQPDPDRPCPPASLNFGLLACGSVAAFFAAMIANVMGWCTTQRNLALSLVPAGIGLARVTMSPLTARLNEAYGWRMALIVVCAVCAPPVALDDHVASADQEVDLVAPYMRMKLGSRQPEPRQHFAHQCFEIAVRRLVAERPSLQRSAQRHDTMSTTLGMADQRGSDGQRRDESIDDEPEERGVDAMLVDSTEVEQRPQRVGGGDTHAPHGPELPHVSRAMDDAVRQASLP